MTREERGRGEGEARGKEETREMTRGEEKLIYI